MICPACGFDDTREVLESYSIILDMSAYSGNQLKGIGSKSHYRYKAAQNKYRRHLFPKLGTIPPAKKKRRLWITRVYRKGKRPFDDDNLHWGLKPLVDALKEKGLLVDDSPKWVERIYKQVPGEHDHIVIFLEDLND